MFNKRWRQSEKYVHSWGQPCKSMQNNKSIGENNTCLKSIRTCCNDNDWPFLCPKCLVTSATVLETICNQVVHLCFVGESNVKRIQASQQKILEKLTAVGSVSSSMIFRCLTLESFLESMLWCSHGMTHLNLWISGSFTCQVDIPNKIIKIRVRDRSKELLRNLCASNQMALQHHGNPKIAGLEPLHLSHLYHGCNLLQIWAINLHPDTIRAKNGKIMEKSRSSRWLTISFSCLRCVPWYSRSRDSQIWLCREILGAVVSQAPNSSSKLWHGTVFYRLCWLAVSNLDPDSDAKYALNKQNICPGLSIIEHNISVFPASKI